MTDQPDDGGPAVPNIAGNTVYSNGMSLRDWFAGQAVSAIPLRDWSEVPGDYEKIEAWAKAAYAVADAMIAERLK